MDQKINEILDGLVSQVLASSMYSNLPEDQKSSLAPKVKTYLNGVIIDTMVDRMSDEQLNAIKDLPADSREMEDKIEEFATTMPNLAQDLEEKLNQVVSDVKQNPQLIG